MFQGAAGAMDSEASRNEPPTVEHSLTLSTAAEKKARAKLLQNLKQCWPRIFPQGRRLAARDYSELIPSFCSYAQDLFNAYMKASDLENIVFWEHVEAIQNGIVRRIAPEPLRGRSWGFEIGEFEAVVEWTRDGWVMKINAPREGGGRKWAGLRSVPDLETGKSLAFSDAANRAGLNPEEIESLRKTREWNDRGYPPKDLYSLIRADLPESPGEWEVFVMMSWRRFDHPNGIPLHSRVQSWFVEVTREPEAHSKLVSALLNGLHERIDYWDAAIEERKESAQSPSAEYKSLGTRRAEQAEGRVPPKHHGVSGKAQIYLRRSQERLALVQVLATELATLKQDLRHHCTAKSLKQKHPDFTVWHHIGDAELQELVEGEPFMPKAYAENLTLRKFGITSRETLKKDRKKIRKAGKDGLI